jgi:uncharacterized damage-inducible protein DinB
MTPAQARTVADFLLSTIETEIPQTIGVFKAVPADRLDYSPDALSKTAMGLVRHLTVEDEWLLNGVADGHFVSWADDSEACGLASPAEAIAAYQTRIPAALARVKALPDEALLREVDMMGALKLPAIQFLSVALRHSCHHRGQLSSYLRAMGGKVPGIYGPTADTRAAEA